MGWASGVEIFDAVADALLADGDVDKKAVLRVLVDALEDGDWDTQSDSIHWGHPLVREVMREAHPDWEDLADD